VWYAGTTDRVVMGEILTAAGTISVGPFPISSHAAGELDAYPGVAFDGNRFVVAWKTLLRHDASLATAHEIRYAPVTPAGVVGTVGLVAADDGSGTITDRVAVAGGTAGRALVAYTGADAPAGYPLARTRIKFLGSSPGPLGGGCVSDADCAQGTCVDGVCCADACAGGALDCQACSILGGAEKNGTCGPVPDGQPCGTRGRCAAAACVEMDAGQPGAPDGSLGRIDAGHGGSSDAASDRPPIASDAAADRPRAADAHPMSDAGRTPDGAAGGSAGRTPDGAAGGAGGGTTGSGGGCGCDSAGFDPRPSTLFAVSIAVLLASRRRRPATRRCLPTPPAC
jgi:hypothetical protein